ncbi:IL-6 subfamily cytokine M17 [Alosa pseudoharengus]|uniref:IL-6 subfamily cytokine M17 n=1 Tax=Alosa pseudoharengus TaxID=34774 RepID=UPI003F89F517
MRGHGSSTPATGSPSLDRNLCVSLLVSLLVCVCVSSVVGVPLAPSSCSSLKKSLKSARVLHWETGQLLETYKANQGEGVEFICQAQSEGVPEATVFGQDWTERLSGLHVRLHEFTPHLRHVAEQQADLQPPSSKLLRDLDQVQLRVPHLASNLHGLLQLLLPNSVLEPPGPTGQPPLPPLNSFQQKAYGCSVLTRFHTFLSNSQKELKALRGVACKRRMDPPSYTTGQHRH